MKRRILIIITMIISLAIIFSSCGSTAVENPNKKAKQAIDMYYKNIINGDYEKAYDLLTSKDKEKISKTKFCLYQIIISKVDPLNTVQAVDTKEDKDEELDGVKYSELIKYNIKENVYSIENEKSYDFSYNRYVVLENGEYKVYYGKDITDEDIVDYAKKSFKNFNEETDNKVLNKLVKYMDEYIKKNNGKVDSVFEEYYPQVLEYKNQSDDEIRAKEEEKKKTTQKKEMQKRLAGKWTKDNIIYLIRNSGVLKESSVFSNENFGCKIASVNNDDRKTKIKNGYYLELTIDSFNEDLGDLNTMKKMTFDIVKLIYDHKKNMDFNLCKVKIHFLSNKANPKYPTGDNFYLGINTINNYFKEPRVNGVGVSGGTGDKQSINYDDESFYTWIEDHFVQPENNSVLAENDSWATTSEKGRIR